jgi:hypothetical protein
MEMDRQAHHHPPTMAEMAVEPAEEAHYATTAETETGMEMVTVAATVKVVVTAVPMGFGGVDPSYAWTLTE